MSIIRVAARHQYLVIDQATAADVDLSWEAKGLHLYLLSRPDDWRVNIHQLAKIGKAKRDKIYRMLSELIERGYAVRNVIRGDGGKIMDYEYLIYEKPLPENPETAPVPENTEVDYSGEKSCDLPLPENPETAPLPCLPCPALPYPENPDTLTNTEDNLILKLPKGSQSIPRGSFDRPLPAASPKRFAIAPGWKPADNFAEHFLFAGLPPTLPWEDELPEFVLYRMSEGQAMTQPQWQHKFIQHLKRTEARRAQSGNSSTPLPRDWQPDRETVSALRGRGLAQATIDDAVLTFTAFWLEDGGFARSWTSKFIEHALHRHNTAPARSSTFDNLTDKSWAAGIALKKSAADLDFDDTSWGDNLDAAFHVPSEGGAR